MLPLIGFHFDLINSVFLLSLLGLPQTGLQWNGNEFCQHTVSASVGTLWPYTGRILFSLPMADSRNWNLWKKNNNLFFLTFIYNVLCFISLLYRYELFLYLAHDSFIYRQFSTKYKYILVDTNNILTVFHV